SIFIDSSKCSNFDDEIMNLQSNFPNMTSKKVQKHTYLKYPHRLLSTSETYKSSKKELRYVI
ncbi:MAG TPA: hypothetical protein PK065_00485, partial [Fervidobacterium sp.]|nr:hypothetical protein [Fervidobacterium sp.]